MISGIATKRNAVNINNRENHSGFVFDMSRIKALEIRTGRSEAQRQWMSDDSSKTRQIYGWLRWKLARGEARFRELSDRRPQSLPLRTAALHATPANPLRRSCAAGTSPARWHRGNARTSGNAWSPWTAGPGRWRGSSEAHPAHPRENAAEWLLGVQGSGGKEGKAERSVLNYFEIVVKSIMDFF